MRDESTALTRSTRPLHPRLHAHRTRAYTRFIVPALRLSPQLNGEMLSANARIAIRHAWESKWYEWPLNLRGILYYAKDNSPEGGEGTTATIYLLGAGEERDEGRA